MQLEDIINGEKFKSEVMNALHKAGLLLCEKHVSLCSEDMPIISNLDIDKNQLQIEYKNKVYHAPVPNAKPEVIRAGLSWLFGYGLIRYDYELPVFKNLDEKSIKQYMKLAVEIWERNIHRDWMQRHKNYKYHNGDTSKGSKFLHGVTSEDENERWRAVEEHRRITDAREDGETPHHIFRDSKRLKKLIMIEGENEIEHKLLVESIYDQATATTRRWVRKDDHKPFEERLFENMKKGYFIKRGEKGKPEKRWKPGFFGFTNKYEDEIWDIWCQAHEQFKDYWIKKFGKNEEFWQPPAPLDKLD